MTLSTSCPKPTRSTPDTKQFDRLTKLRARQAKWRAIALAKSKGKARKPVRQRNEARIKRKAASYRKVIASDFHKALRWFAYERSEARCECEQCVAIRRGVVVFGDLIVNGERIAQAWAEIPIWFTKRGGQLHRRFRSTDGELHHDSYKFFSEENPAELQHVRWVWKSCHQRIEAQHGTRRRFLRGSK